MNKAKLYPIVYGLISALIAFIAIFFILKRTFHLNLQLEILISGIFSIGFFVLSWFRGHASFEIKRIVAKFKLTDQQLAKICQMKASDFPIYHDQLQLILPKRYWARVMYLLQKYEQEHEEEVK